jgi:hypothetical protein
MRYFNLIKNLKNWWIYFFAVKFGIMERDPLLFFNRKGILIQVPRRLIHTFKEIFMEEFICMDLNLSSLIAPSSLI